MPTTTDGNGIVTAKSDSIITVQYSRKMGRENYGNEECGAFMQLPIPDSTDLVDIQASVKAGYTFLKTIVLDQLGVPSTLEGDVVRDTPAAKVAPARKAAAAPAAAKSGGKPDKTTLWQAWVDSPNDWWDNRADKTNPRAPDFKGKKGTAYDGEGLWLDKAPAFAKLVLDGEAA